MSLHIREMKMGELDVFEIETDDAVARVTPSGAHILSYHTFNTEYDILWVSEQAVFRKGKAIRGGIPVCWPWFGKAGTPMHGLARISQWNMSEITEEADGSASLFFTLTLEELKLKARIDVNIGQALTVLLTTENLSGTELKLTDALHTYFTVGDIRQVRVNGFEDCRYRCTVKNTDEIQHGAITFEGETDRIYSAGNRIAVIDDPATDRRIKVERFGSASAVVWNPWTEKAAAMADFGDDEYTEMLCIESANAGDDVRILPPGGTHTVGTRISLI